MAFLQATVERAGTSGMRSGRSPRRWKHCRRTLLDSLDGSLQTRDAQLKEGE